MVGRWLDRLFGALFIWAAAVQLNDPDPVVWVAVYLLGAAVCLVPARFRMGAASAWLVSAATAAWAFWLAPQAMALPQLSDLTASMSVDQPAVEAAREALGLAIVSLWSAGRGVRDQWATGSGGDAPTSG